MHVLLDGSPNSRGAFHSCESAYEILSEQKDFLRIFDGFFLKQKDFCQRCTRFFGSEPPLANSSHPFFLFDLFKVGV